MPRAAHVLSKCIRQWEIGLWEKNEFFMWIDQLDWIDAWHSFISSSNMNWLFTQSQLAEMKKDYLMWSVTFWQYRPWLRTSKMDISTDDFYIMRDWDGNVMLDENWQALYKFHKTWEIVDWSKVENKKEKVLWLFMREQKKMASAPSWYISAKTAMYNYVDYLRKHHPQLMSEYWFEKLNESIGRYFRNIESWKWQKWWYKVILNLFQSEFWNHRYLMSKIMPQFDRILSDRDVAENMLWYNFDNVSFREFWEAAAIYANKARWWNLTVADALWTKYADQIYWAKTLMLFDIDEEWKVTRSVDPKEWHISKTYLMKLSIDQQMEQIKFVLWSKAPSMNKFSMFMKIKLWYNWWWRILRAINFIGNPSFYSALMTFWKWMTWFMPLLILNSGMFVTDTIARWHRLDWDWKSLFNRWNLDDWLPASVDWYSSWIWNTLWDMARWAYSKTANALQQWLFNAWDLVMQNSYKVRQYQLFFEAQFPWIRSVSELNEILEDMARTDKAQLNRLLDAAKTYSEYAIRLNTTNTSVFASLIRTHAAKNPINQPMLDTWYVMRNFFAWWWYNKILWAWTIFKDWIQNIYHWRIWSKYLDELLASKVPDVDEAWNKVMRHLTEWEVNAAMSRAYLENEQFIYFFNKLYISMMIWKYLDRLTEDYWAKDEETIFEDFTDMLSFMDVFSWDYAALTANPHWRLVKSFFDTFIWELENWTTSWTATAAATAAATKEAFRSFFRRLYIPQIATEYISLTNANWDMEESTWLSRLKKSIQDNVHWYLFYLKDTTENWEYSYYIPKWPNAYVNSILGKSPKSVEFVNDQKSLSKLANLNWSLELDSLFNAIPWNTFHNWVIYSFPFLKQWNISQIVDVEKFIDDHDKFRRTKEYNDMVNWYFPSDMENHDWEYVYNIVTRRLLNNEDKIINEDLSWLYSFKTDEWETLYNKTMQTQEYIIHKLMKDWLTEDQANDLIKRMNKKTDWYDEEAIRTLAYMEAKTPWSSLQAVAYLMNKEWLDYVYKSWKKYEWDALLYRQEMWKIEAAKKFAQYVPFIDRYNVRPQFILHYAKTHDTALAKYIEWPWDSNSWTMKLITPWSTKDKDWIIYQNSMLRQNFQAQLMVDIEWANWNPDARKLMNWFSLIFNTSNYENPDWSLQPKYAAYALNQIETIYNHVDSLAMDENSKRVLKQGTLMFWDKLFMSIMNDEKLSAREDVQQVLKDWTTYWYREFRELDQIAIEAAEDQLSNKERRSYWAKKDYLNSWINKKFKWFTNRYDYMKNRAYNKNYLKYRVFDWIPRTYEKDYLSRYDFDEAKRSLWWFTSIQKKKDSSWLWSIDGDRPGWTWKRWKAIAFYKQEDINKPVEYRTPRRKRRVRRWSWVKPISTRTWKSLTPKPKQ